MTDTRIDETSPDHLMDNFRGRSMKSIIFFTLVVHVVGLTATSTSYLWKLVAGADSSKLSEEERVQLAVKEATSSLRGIAEKHGLKAQDLGERFTSKAPKAEIPKTNDPKAETPKTDAPITKNPTAEIPTKEPAEVPANGDGAQPGKPKSSMEKQIESKANGPAMPGLDNEKEDLFK